MNFNSNLFLGYNNNFFQSGVKATLNWDYVHYPHMLVFGSTGSGKTYFVKLLLARIGLHLPNGVVTICDFKADDFKFLSDCENYYGFSDCTQGLENYYNVFKARQNGEDDCRDFRLLMFDELSSYLNTLDKKETENAKSKLATLLMLGRSFNIHVLLSQQRADSSYFGAGARDNFSVVIALGNISKESKQMFFTDFKDEMLPCRQGEGYVLLNACNMKRIVVPSVRNENKLKYYIKKSLG